MKCRANDGKQYNVGETWGARNEERIRSAFVSHAEAVPILTLLIKDHKIIKAGELYPTRPVVGVSDTLISRLSQLLSDIIKRLADELGLDGSQETKSRENLQAEIIKVNKEWKDEAKDVFGT